MKKEIVWVLVLVILFILPQISALDNDLSALPRGTQIIINNSPFNERGEIDNATIGNYTYKIDKKINGINVFFNEKLFWLKYVFGAVPEISWVFGINFLLWIILFCLLVLIIPNFNISVKIPTGLFVLIGFGALFVLSWFKLIFRSAELLNELAITWWGKTVVILILIFLLIFLFSIQNIALKQKEKRNEKIKDIKRDRQAEKIAKEAVKEEVVKTQEKSGEDKEDLEEEAEEEASAIKGMADED